MTGPSQEYEEHVQRAGVRRADSDARPCSPRGAKRSSSLVSARDLRLLGGGPMVAIRSDRGWVN